MSGPGLGLGASFVALLLGVLPYVSSFLETVELKTYDRRLRLTADPATARADIVLVEINEPSLRALEPVAGRWPWPRAVHASVIDFLAFRRRGIEIPWPIRVNYTRQEEPAETPERVRMRAGLLGSVAIFAPLSDAERLALAASPRERLFADREAIVRQGAEGRSLFVVSDGKVRVTIEPGDHEVATLERGAYFGEMSLLTGEPRTATVTAIGDCAVIEISDDAFRPVAEANPAIIDEIGQAALERRRGLQETKDAAAQALVQVDTPITLASRIRKFLRLA